MGTTLQLSADLDVLGVPVTLEGDVSPAGTSLSAKFDGAGTLKLGTVLSEIYALAVPGGQLTLDSPWDALTGVDIAFSDLTFEVDTAGPRIGLHVQAGGIGVGDFLNLTSLGVSFSHDSVTKRNRVDLSIEGTFLGLEFQAPHALTWDLLREPPPEAPGKGPAILDLRYIGLGQHITLNPTPSDMATVLQELEQTAPPSPDTTPPFGLTFDGNAGWLAGLDLTVLDTVSLSAIFNDPNLYGLLVSLSGARAKALAGFSFEILYHRIDSTVGVYHIELKLPEDIRHIDVGEAALTLPIIDIDIYTDGGFLIDFGFPWNHDFSRSMTIDVIVLGIPVQGAAGFYFGVLDAHTATGLQTPTNGVFSPVIAFGVGAQIGIGKDFQKGPLTASFLIAIEGILEGMLAFFHPNDPSTPAATYFQATGMVAVTGHLFGAVDFAVIKARVDILVQVSVQIVFEVYKAVNVELDASVDISLSVEVDLELFSFSMDLEFHAAIQEQAVFGSDQTAPWIT
ncbi:MAG TPA: hypothetical protein VN893_18200 [Bryobacteraceae bacterium]|nr:hypothetical protein [Bryobacteraceae bacterium]